MNKLDRILVLYFILILAIALVLPGCISIDDPSVLTPSPEASPVVTDVVDPTPTQETETWTPEPTDAPYWDVTCADGTEPINPVACPSDYIVVNYEGTVQHVPATMQLRIDPITDGATTMPTLRVIDGKLRLNVSGFAGEIGIQIHNIHMEPGNCYTFNVPLSFTFLGASNFQNYWYDSRIYATDGSVADLNNHAVILTPGGRGVMFGSRPSAPGAPDAVWWNFAPSRAVEIVWEFVYHATWASTGGSHHIDIEAFIIQDQFNTGICN